MSLFVDSFYACPLPPTFAVVINDIFMNTKMNKLLCMMVVLLSLAACTDDTEYTAGVWYRRSDFDGVARTDAAGFTIGNVGYLCTGYRGVPKTV